MITVQSLWVGEVLPPLQQLSIRSFLAHGHQYHLYAYGDLQGAPEGAVVIDAATILPAESIFYYQYGFGQGSVSAFSNLFRYKLICERGGWWVDTDVVCLKPFEFDVPYVFATETDDLGATYCASCVFKCPAGAPVMQHCLNVATLKDKASLVWAEIGPRLVTEAVDEYRLTAFRVPTETFAPIHYFDFASVVAPGFDMTRLANSSAIHLWNQMWKSEGLDPAANPPDDSLYGILRRRYAVDTDSGKALGAST